MRAIARPLLAPPENGATGRLEQTPKALAALRVDHLTFAIELVKAVAWPAVASASLFTFRAQIGGALSRLRRVKAPGLEADLSETLDEVQSGLPDGASPQPKAIQTALSQIQTGISPSTVVVAAWTGFHNRLRSLSKSEDLPMAVDV